MNANELMIDDWVSIDGHPRQVCAITKKKVGYHVLEGECRMHYARLKDVEPLKIETVEFEHDKFVINGGIYIEFDPKRCSFEMTDSHIYFGNIYDERVVLLFGHVHRLQRRIGLLDYTGRNDKSIVSSR